jgi:hypothetical protein
MVDKSCYSIVVVSALDFLPDSKVPQCRETISIFKSPFPKIMFPRDFEEAAFVVSHQPIWRHVMKTIIRFFKRVLVSIRHFLGQVFSVIKNLFGAMLAAIVMLVKRGTFALPQDEFEKLEVLQFGYKTLTIVLVLTVLFTGVWLDQHRYPSWTALLLFALRLLYALPAGRVERALRKHQVQEREKVRASYADPGSRRAKSA